MNNESYHIVTRWVIPEDRFIEWEPRDERWAIPLGMGSLESVKVLVMDNVFD